MRAIEISEPGGPEVLRLVQVPSPICGENQIDVAVRAVGVNRADILQRMGLYPPPPGVSKTVPGLEFAGEVAAVGSGVSKWIIGDRVMGLVAGGAYAERLVLHEREALPMPHGMDFSTAAAIPEAFVTAWDALVTQGGLRLGDTVLIHAAGSGVGTAAVQLVSAFGGHSIGTSRTASKLERAAKLGLGEAIHVKDGAFARAVLASTQGRGVDLVLDLVGGNYLSESLNCMALKGRLVLVGLLAGRTAEVPLGVLLRARLSVQGTVLRSRPIEEKMAIAQRFGAQVLPLFAGGRIAPLVDQVFDFEQAADAHRKMQSSNVFGKIVLAWS